MLISIIVISLIGVLLHFLYEISGHNKIMALFAAVNESTWEHIKITLTSILLWSLFDGFKYGMMENYFIAKSLSMLGVIIVIPAIFYTYTFFTKKSILIIDITTFFLTIIGGQAIFYYFIKLSPLGFIYNYLSVILIFLIYGFYMVSTLQPVKHFMFKDPISNKYGKKGHTETDQIINHKKLSR